YNEYNKLPMTPFPQLSEDDISDILAYTAEEKKAAPAEAAPAAGSKSTSSGSGDSGTSNTISLGALALLFAVLAIALILVRRTLNRFAEDKGVVTEKHEGISLWKAFVKNQFLVIVTVILLLLASAYFVYGYLMQIGVDQGYMPVQPIHYSHRIHAGDNAIDCK